MCEHKKYFETRYTGKNCRDCGRQFFTLPVDIDTPQNKDSQEGKCITSPMWGCYCMEHKVCHSPQEKGGCYTVNHPFSELSPQLTVLNNKKKEAMGKDIVYDFLEGTAVLRKALMPDFKQCPICGMNVDKMEKLAEAIKVLKEKAWKYDSLG